MQKAVSPKPAIVASKKRVQIMVGDPTTRSAVRLTKPITQSRWFFMNNSFVIADIILIDLANGLTSWWD